MPRRRRDDLHPALLSHLYGADEEESELSEMEELWPQLTINQKRFVVILPIFPKAIDAARYLVLREIAIPRLLCSRMKGVSPT